MSSKIIKDLDRSIKGLTQAITKMERTIVKKSEKIRCLTLEVNLSKTEKTKQKYQARLDEVQEDLDRDRVDQCSWTEQRDAQLAEKQRLQELPVQDSESALRERTQPATVMVRLLSGDILPVEICMSDLISHFPSEFVTQHKYNPNIINRLEFLIMEADDEKNLQYDYYATPEMKSFSWSDEFKTAEDIPVINLFIQSEHELDIAEKIKLIHQILVTKKMESLHSDDELYSLYADWNLHFQPLPDSNRYTNMTTFLEQKQEYFRFFNEQELDEKKKVADRERRNRIRAAQSEFIQSKCTYWHDFSRLREIAIQHLLHWVESAQPASTLTNADRKYYRQYMTVEEIFAFGFPAGELCYCDHDQCHVCHIDQE